MKYKELKKLIKTNSEISKKIYITNFFTCRLEKLHEATITLITNILGHYVVTHWLDYEYNYYKDRKIFKNKDLAADYAWELFNGLNDK